MTNDVFYKVVVMRKIEFNLLQLQMRLTNILSDLNAYPLGSYLQYYNKSISIRNSKYKKSTYLLMTGFKII